MNSKEKIVYELTVLFIFIGSVWTAAELDWGIGIGIWVAAVLSAGLLLLWDIIAN
ncbi:MAG: hypothetical protein RL288_931 [Actinomycetota bacterium]|jgi:hypothetical protein